MRSILVVRGSGPEVDPRHFLDHDDYTMSDLIIQVYPDGGGRVLKHRFSQREEITFKTVDMQRSYA